MPTFSTAMRTVTPFPCGTCANVNTAPLSVSAIVPCPSSETEQVPPFSSATALPLISSYSAGMTISLPLSPIMERVIERSSGAE